MNIGARVYELYVYHLYLLDTMAAKRRNEIISIETMKDMCTQYAYAKLNKLARRNIVMSTYDVTEQINIKYGHVFEQLWPTMETDIETFVNELCNKRLVYRHACWNSYFDLVRSINNVSYTEHAHRKKIANNPKCRMEFRDTEFPVDDAGNYVKPA